MATHHPIVSSADFIHRPSPLLTYAFKACFSFLRLTSLKPQQAPNQSRGLSSAGDRPARVRALSAQPRPRQPTWFGVTHINEPLLVLLRHLGQPVVAAGQVPLEALQGHDGHVLHLPPLGPGAGGRQAQPADAAARAHPR